MLPGEREWVSKVVADLSEDDLKLVYADWLEEQGDPRSAFLRQYVAASRSMDASDLPDATGLPGEWLELIGFRLIQLILRHSCPDLKASSLLLARPALSLYEKDGDDTQLPIGASKVGGQPDLPPGFRWPTGDDCKAIYNDDTAGDTRLAGFLAQVNLADFAHTQAARELPKEGLLSFFCFQDIENDNPDVIGARALFFPDTTGLVRTTPPSTLTLGNYEMPCCSIWFEEILDLPERYNGPWSADLEPPAGVTYDPVFEVLRDNERNMFGYGRATSGDYDPTPDESSRHLILLENSVNCWLHIQISQSDLDARNFDNIKLVWVDFD